MPSNKNKQNQGATQASQDFNNQPRVIGGQKPGNQNDPPQTPTIVLKNLELTEYLDDGRLAFSKKDDEIWTLTPGQKDFKAAFHKRDLLILRGPAGSGKTDITAREVLGLLKDGFADRILLTAPIDEGGEEIGFRTGNTFEKMLEHVNQYLEAFDGHLGQGDFRKGKKIRDALIAQGTIELQPMGTLSGKNLRRTILIVDEAHKARMQHLLIAQSRLHTNGSKVIFSGDEKQHMSNGVSAFREFAKRFSNPAYADYIAPIEYNADDIKRHPLTKLIVERGDDVPPGLAARMKEEEFTPERIKGLLTKHFDNVNKGKKDPMTEQVVRTYLSRQPEHVLLDLMQQSLETSAPEPGA